MSLYTLELRQILSDVNIKIFNNYPIFDETYRVVLETKIKNHFYFREIGTETVGRFIFNLNTMMDEIMPRYNKMYIATKLEQRILDNYDITETYGKNTTIGENGTTNNKRLYSDTPQGRVNISSGEFVSDITDDTITDNSTGTGTENWIRKMKGNIGVQNDSQAVKVYIESLYEIDRLIIADLNILFMGVY